jgi:transposase InsO family protein
MRTVVSLLLFAIVAQFRSSTALEAELLALRHQLLVVHRCRTSHPRLNLIDRVIWIWLYRVWPSCLDALVIVKPETVVRWHPTGFRAYWRWKSRSRGGRPKIEAAVRRLVREISRDNPLWGAPRIHGELSKLGIEIAQSTVARYMIRRRGPPSQSWSTFLRNHAPAIAAVDLFAVPTIGFKLLYALVILRLDRRRLVWINTTASPSAAWIAHQITEAFPWDEAPVYLIRDQDRAFGTVFVRRVRAMGIRDRPIAPPSPWQNGHVERLIGSIRRECLDHIIVRSEDHLRAILSAYPRYHNETGTHLALGKDSPESRPIQSVGHISAFRWSAACTIATFGFSFR